MKIKNFTKIFLFVAVAALFSCSSSNDGGNGDGDGDGGGLTSITITASSQFVDFGSTVNFTVKTNEGTDVTSSASILVNNESISGSSFTATETGEYSVKATYETLTSSAINVNVLPVIVSIEIQSAELTYNLGDRVEFQVFGIDNDGNSTNVTSAASVFIDGSESFSGATVIPGSTGTMDAYGTFNGFTSETRTVTIEDNASTPTAYQRKALIEDYTGTWCGFCPRVSVGIELAQEASDNVVAVAIHNSDPMANSFGGQMENAVDIQGFPTAWINRSAEWAFPEPSNVNQVTSLAFGTTNNGVAINSAIKGNNLSFMVSTGFGQSVSGAKLVIFLLENGLIYDQTNYYPEYYTGEDPIEDFVHDHVLRHSFTSVLGDNIPSGEASANNTYRVKYDYPVPASMVQNAAKIEIVAMLLNSNGEIINLNVAKAGEFANFN
jgi:hypothetical protein